MQGNSGFSLESQEQTGNQELNIVFTPHSTTRKLMYEILKDGNSYETYEITTSKAITIPLTETGTFQIRVTEYGANSSSTQMSGLYKLDFEKPVITVQDSSLTVYQTKKGQELDFSNYVKAYDEQTGNLTKSITSNIDELDLSKIGLTEITFTVSDGAGNITTKTVPLNVIRDPGSSLLAIQIVIITLLALLLWRVIIYRRSLSLERRLAKYSVDPIRNNSESFTDKLGKFYRSVLEKMRGYLKKSVFLQKHSKKYRKYLPIYHSVYEDEIDLISCKFLSAGVLLVVAIFSKTIQYQVITLYESVLPIIFGFFLPDLIFISRYKLYRNELENDLLQAIIIMNNAFKSGRSITQAVDLVTKELKGPIGREFEKIAMELSFGLEVDVVFDRFSKRVALEEVAYLTASLSILNRTGGNIIKVFSSIESSMFNKKKLKLELLSLTGGSKIIVIVLIAIPILFILFISLISPTYLSPLITTDIGRMLSGIIFILYSVYIMLVRKIMKVRM